MYLIIFVMALSMIGIGMIQFIWFASSVEQDKTNFDDKVKIAMGIVKERLMKDAQEGDVMMKKWDEYKRNKESKPLLLKEYREFNNIVKKIKDNNKYKNIDLNGSDMLVNPNSFLERIQKDNLDTYLKHEIEQQDIDLNFDYGVYSKKEMSFIIMNGNFTASIGTTNQSTNVETGNDLYNSEYKIPLFDTAISNAAEGDPIENAPGYLQVYFPNKEKALWSAVIPSLIMSILFTGLVLFCFGFVMYVIQRQKQVSEMKTDFINNMTHEFKTPIATISLASDSIVSPMILNNPDKVMRFTNIIKQENKRMLNQVEKVLQMAMLDKKDFQLKLSSIDVHDLISTAAEHMSLKVLKRNGILRTDLKAKSTTLNADATHLSNIIHNLLDNAEKYSSENVDIIIGTENTKSGIMINISDNGIGMTKDQLKNIFEKFYRAHTGNIHDVKGFGLGLSYVKAIVDAHGGTINVKSEIGKGSTFSIYLPQNAA
jgi:two-component system phosphate regulon sensor histidine kinase PhoR